MANCINCSAPLPTNSVICHHCGSRNDVDLHAATSHHVSESYSERICPKCEIRLKAYNITVGEEPNVKEVEVDRCELCFGLFFDPGELEFLLTHSVSNVFHVNHELLGNINRESRIGKEKNVYRKCPVCSQFMVFKNYAKLSGVIVDFCKGHGIWLDGGELKHLMEWAKAGGMLHHQTSVAEQPKRKPVPNPVSYSSTVHSSGRMGSRTDDSIVNLIEGAVRLLFKF